MKFILVVMLLGFDQPMIALGSPFPSLSACYSAALTLQVTWADDLIWWNCEQDEGRTG